MSGMTTRSSNRRKTSSLAQLSGSKPPPPAPSNPATPNSRKRKPEPALKERVETFFEAADADVSKSNKRQKMSSSSNISTNASAKKPKKDEEKRLRGFRNKPPISYKQKLERAQTQRMIVLNRNRGGTDDVPKEDIDIVGSTGNIYTVTVSQTPSCTCPDHMKGNQCKHVVYVLHNVLKAPEDLQYQLAFLSSELRLIFSSCPPIPTEKPTSSDDDDNPTPNNRKPFDSGECPICYMDFDAAHNDLVWCKAACGNNMHRSCFDQWAASQRGQTLRCVYCRTPWQQSDPTDLKGLSTTASVGEDGYLNVASQFGLSDERDMSTYNQFWVRRQMGRGYY